MRPIKSPMSIGGRLVVRRPRRPARAPPLPQWPYAKACGWWLSLYMAAVGIVVVAGLWGAHVSWRSRLGFAHVIAVATIIWGLALTAQEVLPRVGYAKERLAWRCHDASRALSAVRLTTRRSAAGSSASRTASPTKLNPTTVTKSAAPGPKTIQGACWR